MALARPRTHHAGDRPPALATRWREAASPLHRRRSRGLAARRRLVCCRCAVPPLVALAAAAGRRLAVAGGAAGLPLPPPPGCRVWKWARARQGRRGRGCARGGARTAGRSAAPPAGPGRCGGDNGHASCQVKLELLFARVNPRAHGTQEPGARRAGPLPLTRVYRRLLL